MAEAKQKRYGFGAREEVYQLHPSALHYLEWPLYLQFRNGRQYLEAGLSVQYLLGVQGQLNKESSLFPWELLQPSQPLKPATRSETVERGLVGER